MPAAGNHKKRNTPTADPEAHDHLVKLPKIIQDTWKASEEVPEPLRGFWATAVEADKPATAKPGNLWKITKEAADKANSKVRGCIERKKHLEAKLDRSEQKLEEAKAENIQCHEAVEAIRDELALAADEAKEAADALADVRERAAAGEDVTCFYDANEEELDPAAAGDRQQTAVEGFGAGPKDTTKQEQDMDVDTDLKEDQAYMELLAKKKQAVEEHNADIQAHVEQRKKQRLDEKMSAAKGNAEKAEQAAAAASVPTPSG